MGCCVPYQPCWEQVNLPSTQHSWSHTWSTGFSSGLLSTKGTWTDCTNFSEGPPRLVKDWSTSSRRKRTNTELQCRVPTLLDAYLFSYVIRWYQSLVSDLGSTFCRELWKASRLWWRLFLEFTEYAWLLFWKIQCRMQS